MSEIKSFSDYTSKYNSNVDFSALFSGMSDSSSIGNTNMLSDYAAIKNGSYGKLMKAYYAKQDAEKLSGKGDTSQKLTLMKTSADSLKKSADALNDSSLWEKKKIKKKDEKTGEEIEVEDYDWDKITKAVKSFVEDYNDVVKEAGESNTKDALKDLLGGTIKEMMEAEMDDHLGYQKSERSDSDQKAGCLRHSWHQHRWCKGYPDYLR